MSVKEIFNRYVETEGWSKKTQEIILDRFVVSSNQEISFADFLDGKAQEEGADIEPAYSLDDFKIPMGWDENTTVSLLLEFLENHNTQEFEVFLSEQTEDENEEEDGEVEADG